MPLNSKRKRVTCQLDRLNDTIVSNGTYGQIATKFHDTLTVSRHGRYRNFPDNRMQERLFEYLDRLRRPECVFVLMNISFSQISDMRMQCSALDDVKKLHSPAYEE